MPVITVLPDHVIVSMHPVALSSQSAAVAGTRAPRRTTIRDLPPAHTATQSSPAHATAPLRRLDDSARPRPVGAAAALSLPVSRSPPPGVFAPGFFPPVYLRPRAIPPSFCARIPAAQMTLIMTLPLMWTVGLAFFPAGPPQRPRGRA